MKPAPWKMLSPSTKQTLSLPINSLPMMKACARPSGVGSGNDEYLANACEHKHRNGIIHHRFVENGEQLFAHSFGDGIEARAASSGQYDSFHI